MAQQTICDICGRVCNPEGPFPFNILIANGTFDKDALQRARVLTATLDLCSTTCLANGLSHIAGEIAMFAAAVNSIEGTK